MKQRQSFDAVWANFVGVEVKPMNIGTLRSQLRANGCRPDQYNDSKRGSLGQISENWEGPVVWSGKTIAEGSFKFSTCPNSQLVYYVGFHFRKMDAAAADKIRGFLQRHPEIHIKVEADKLIFAARPKNDYSGSGAPAGHINIMNGSLGVSLFDKSTWHFSSSYGSTC